MFVVQVVPLCLFCRHLPGPRREHFLPTVAGEPHRNGPAAQGRFAGDGRGRHLHRRPHAPGLFLWGASKK